MSARQVVVYRLNLTPPPEAADPEWMPPGWERFWADLTGDPSVGLAGYCPPFRLPGRRHYFSRAAAEKWAERMRKWGCTAEVEPSSPVTWPQEQP